MHKQDTIQNFTGLRGSTSTQRKFQQKKLGLKKSGSDPASTNDNSDLKIAGASKLDSIVQQIESLQKIVEEQQRTLTERERANSELKELVTAQADKINELKESNTQLSTKLAQSDEEQKAAIKELNDDLTTAMQNSKEELSSQIAQMKQDYSQKTEQNLKLVNENSQKLEDFTSMFQQLIIIALNNGLEIKEVFDSVGNFQTFVVEVFELDEAETERQFPDNSREDKEEFLAKCQECLPNIDTGIIKGFQRVIEGQYTEIEESLTGENTENTEVTEL